MGILYRVMKTLQLLIPFALANDNSDHQFDGATEYSQNVSNLHMDTDQHCQIEGNTEVRIYFTDNSTEANVVTMGTAVSSEICTTTLVSDHDLDSPMPTLPASGIQLVKRRDEDGNFFYFLRFDGYKCGAVYPFQRDLYVTVRHGFHQDTNFYAFKDFKFRSICDFESDQKAFFNFDRINTTDIDHDETTMYNGVNFSLRGYTNGYDVDEIMPGDDIDTGERMYLTLESDLPLSYLFNFVPSKCVVQEKDTENSYVLFDWEVNDGVNDAPIGIERGYYYNDNGGSVFKCSSLTLLMQPQIMRFIATLSFVTQAGGMVPSLNLVEILLRNIMRIQTITTDSLTMRIIGAKSNR